MYEMVSLLVVVAGIMLILFIGLYFITRMTGKPIQHCGASMRNEKGEKTSCPLCQGDPDDCTNAEERDQETLEKDD